MYKENDVFVSHSIKDTDELELPALVKEWRTYDHDHLRVFVDFEDEILKKKADEGIVDAEVAQRLLEKIKKSYLFVFVASRRSVSSHWMPWELGLAHGAVGNVHVYVPGATDPAKFQNAKFRNREYLELYRSRFFGPGTAREYLKKEVDSAKGQLATPADEERAMRIGLELKEASKRGDPSELANAIAGILEQGAGTERGFLGPFPQGTPSLFHALAQSLAGGVDPSKFAKVVEASRSQKALLDYVLSPLSEEALRDYFESALSMKGVLSAFNATAAIPSATNRSLK